MPHARRCGPVSAPRSAPDRLGHILDRRLDEVRLPEDPLLDLDLRREVLLQLIEHRVDLAVEDERIGVRLLLAGDDHHRTSAQPAGLGASCEWACAPAPEECSW